MAAKRKTAARRRTKTTRKAGATDRQLPLSVWADVFLLATLAAGVFVALSVYYPSFSRPYGQWVHGQLFALLGAGMYPAPLILLILPLFALAGERRRLVWKLLAWALCLSVLTALFGGLFSIGGLLGDSCASLGFGALGWLYTALLVVVTLLVIGRLSGRSLLVPLARGTVRAAIRTGEAVAEVGSAVRDEAAELAEQRRLRNAEKKKERAALEREREARRKQIIAAEIEAADAPEGDSPLIREKLGGRKVVVQKIAEADKAATASAEDPGPAVAIDDPGFDYGLLKEDAGEASAESQALESDKEGQLLIFPSTQAGYALPPITLLKQAPALPEEDYHLEQRSRVIETTLKSFNVEARCFNAVIGPRVTRFELKIGPGINVNKIHGLADNLALELAVKAVRIEAPIPGKSAVGIEVPNAIPELITLRGVIESPQYQHSNHPLTVGLGRDIAGNPIVANIAKMPHLLVAGATGSGKSVCLNAVIVSMLMRNAPDTLRFILIDPKRVEMTNYKDIPHLACPVVHDVMEAQSALKWAVAEMDRRYRVLEQSKARNIAAYNEMVDPGRRLPFIVIVVDELADLMMMAGPVIEKLVCRIAQLSRAVGIHLVIATQRPDVKVITGTIKANIPSRIAFAVVSHIDSRTILDGMGAEKLLGSGDMLFSPIGENIPLRVQGAYLDDAEIDRVVEWCKSQSETHYDDSITQFSLDDEDNGGGGGDGGQDEYFAEARDIVQQSQRASTSYLQRRLKIGYNRAARIMEELEDAGVVSPPDAQGNRKVL